MVGFSRGLSAGRFVALQTGTKYVGRCIFRRGIAPRKNRDIFPMQHAVNGMPLALARTYRNKTRLFVDLRVRLLTYLSGFSVLLLGVACLTVVSTLRKDVGEEIEASTRLVELLLAIGEARQTGSEPLRHLLADNRLRHVALFLERSKTEQPLTFESVDPFASALVRLTLGGMVAPPERRIRLGEETLLIRTDPRSEVQEILRDATRMLGTLLFFSLGTLLLAWLAVQRALQPVRAFEDGLERLARGEDQAVLPRFELREFRRIASAIDRLAARLGESRASERRLARRLLELQESERRGLARELHDEFGQSLTAIAVAAAFIERHASTADSAALAECARDIRSQATQVTSHVCGLLRQLRPHGIENMGIVDTLRELIDGWRQRAPEITLDTRLTPDLPQLAPNSGLALYRTLQEALTNVLRHSGASRVDIALTATADEVCLTVTDNGRGNATTVLQQPGCGLHGMFERAQMAGGQLVLGDATNSGLRLELRLPASKGNTEENRNELADNPHPVA